MKKIIILDTSTTEVHVYNIPNVDAQTSEKTEEWITKKTTHKLSECSWMILPKTFQIYFH